MTNKEKIEALNYIWFYEPSCQEDVDKREAIIKELKKDLEVLEILIKNIKLIDYRVFTDKIVIFLPVCYRQKLKEIEELLENGKD